MKKQKFDKYICKECAWYYSVSSEQPRCNYLGKHIYDGECLAFKEKAKPLSQADKDAIAYNKYQEEWN